MFEVGFSSDWLPPPLANYGNNRRAMVKRQEGKKGMCSRIYISWVPAAPEAFQGLLTWKPYIRRICMKPTLMGSPCS